MLAVIDVYVGVTMLAGLLITMMTLFIMVIITINTYILILIAGLENTHNMADISGIFQNYQIILIKCAEYPHLHWLTPYSETWLI